MTVLCIECEGNIGVAGDVMLGEIILCPDCGVELEVRSTHPLICELAPEIEEDWGE